MQAHLFCLAPLSAQVVCRCPGSQYVCVVLWRHTLFLGGPWVSTRLLCTTHRRTHSDRHADRRTEELRLCDAVVRSVKGKDE